MLACRPAQHLSFAERENQFGCTSGLQVLSYPHHPDFYEPCMTAHSSREPLIELQNSFEHDTQRLDSSDKACMQRGTQISQDVEHDGWVHSRNLHHAAGQDSGLGIITDENDLRRYGPNSLRDQDNILNFTEDGTILETTRQPKLESPFDEDSYHPATSWGQTYPGSTISDSSSTAFTNATNANMLSTQSGMYESQYTMSPASMTPYMMGSGQLQPEQFRRPLPRQNSSSSTIPQSSFYPYGTPSFDASPTQWTPETTMSDWQANNVYAQQPHIPSVYLDYSACHEESDQTCTHGPNSVRTMTAGPGRRKPHLRPSFSESCVPRTASTARMRAASMGHFLHTPPYDQYAAGVPVQQLPLPPMPPSALIQTPQLPNQPSMLPGTPASSHRHSRSTSNTPHRRKRPSSPPASDFAHNNMPYLAPIRQEPTFAGDLYTPRYKRRTPTGRWEGWCGYCTPGRWLDLKNSRFWEDKLRNHGICAKTKMRFDEPVQIRWVSSDGSVIPEAGLAADTGDPFMDQRKREGLCGVCHKWIGMDGLRTKARDRAVGWWMHAYKCHDHDKAAEQQSTGA